MSFCFVLTYSNIIYSEFNTIPGNTPDPSPINLDYNIYGERVKEESAVELLSDTDPITEKELENLISSATVNEIDLQR